MPTTNDFLPFATGAGANILDQADYASLAARSSGFEAGTAESQQLNKVWRQSSFQAVVLATFVQLQLGIDVVDDGNITAAEANLVSAIARVVTANNGMYIPVSGVKPVAGDINRNILVATAAANLEFVQSAQLGVYFRIEVFALGGAITVTPYGTETVNGGAAGASLVIPQGFVGTLTTDGVGALYALTDAPEVQALIAACLSAAETFAVNAANTAQSNAETYAAAQAATAQSNAESFASAADATNLTTAETFATGAANTAQSNAETYAAAQAATAQSNAETYAAAQATGAQSAAELYAYNLQLYKNGQKAVLFGYSGGTLTTSAASGASVTRASQGVYNITFAAAFPDANYFVDLSVAATASDNDLLINYSAASKTNGGITVQVLNTGAGPKDSTDISCVFGHL